MKPVPIQSLQCDDNEHVGGLRFGSQSGQNYTHKNVKGGYQSLGMGSSTFGSDLFRR